MTLEPQSLAVFVASQGSSAEYLDVTTACATNPVPVRSALLKALRRVRLRSIDITLLRLEHELLAAFNSHWRKPNKLQLVLESCRQGTCAETVERLFYKHGGDFAIVILGVATRRDSGFRTNYDGRWLLRDISALSNEEMIELITNVCESPPESVRKDVTRVIEFFAKRPLGTDLATHYFVFLT